MEISIGEPVPEEADWDADVQTQMPHATLTVIPWKPCHSFRHPTNRHGSPTCKSGAQKPSVIGLEMSSTNGGPVSCIACEQNVFSFILLRYCPLIVNFHEARTG